MYKSYLENIENNNNFDNIEKLTYGSVPFGSSAIGSGATEGLRVCPVSLKYSGDTVTLQTTPKDGIGPYYVVFRKGVTDIDPSRLVDEFSNPAPNPIIDASEDVQITRIYTLDDVDISGALTGTIDFSVYIEDKCPTGHKTCEEHCIISIGCVAPVCNFTVT